MPKLPKNYKGGLLIPDHFEPSEYLAGAISGIVHEDRNTTGDWTSFLPTDESQRFKYFDDYGCVTHSGENSLEIQLEFLQKSELMRKEDYEWLNYNGYTDENGFNFDDRSIVVLSGTIPNQGNYVHKVWDAFRKIGLIPPDLIPFNSEWRLQDYYSKDDFPPIAYNKGQEFLKRFWIQYERVLANDFEKALKHAPLIVGVPTCPGWDYSDIVPACNRSANHATILVKMDERYYHIYDSYEPYIKRLPRAYNIQFAYKGLITPITNVSGEDKADQYIFNNDLEFGDYSNEVTELSKRLILENTLVSPNPPNPHYSPEIVQAVRGYMAKYKIGSWWENNIYPRGRRVGPKIRQHLNTNQFKSQN